MPNAIPLQYSQILLIALANAKKPYQSSKMCRRIKKAQCHQLLSISYTDCYYSEVPFHISLPVKAKSLVNTVSVI